MNIDVLHLLPSLSLYGGTPRKIHDLIQASSRQHGIYCWTRWEDAQDSESFEKIFISDGIPVYQGNNGYNLIKHASDIARIIDKHDIKVVHGYFESGLILAALAKMIRKKTKAAVSFVGFPAPSGIAKKFLFNLLTRKIDHIVYVSKFTKNEFTEKYPNLKVRPSTVIYNGVKARNPGTLHQKSEDTWSMATVSGLVEWKNIGLLLDTIQLLKNEPPNQYKLLLIGDGPLRNELERYANTLGIHHHVEFLGYRSDVGSLLSGCQAYLHPAISEGFGIAVVEAMLMGIPVVVADAGALPELVEDNISGMVICPKDAKAWADAIIRLRKNPDLAQRLGDAGQKRAREFFSINRFVDDHEKMYLELLSAIQ